MKQITRTLYYFYCAIIYPLFFAYTFLTITAILSFHLFIKNEHFLSFFSIAYGKLIAFFIPIIIKVDGLDNIEKGKSYVIVANHKSMADIPILWSALGRDIRFVMKKELMNIALFGTACKALGEIPVDRGNPIKAKQSIDIAKQKVKNGVCVVFFPEGTRVPGKKVGSFKKGAFHFALDVDVPVLPISIEGSENILPKKNIFVHPGRVKVTLHKPVDQKQYEKKTVNDFADVTRSTITNTLRYEI